MSTTPIIIKPHGHHPELEVVLDRYLHDGSLAIQTYSPCPYTDALEPYARLSVCVEGITPEENCFWFKDYSENSGLLDAALASNLGTLTGRTAISGFALLNEFRLNPDYVDQIPDVLQPAS
jgi:hypothetical protein